MRWIEALSPVVIVCIGKWVFDNLPGSIRAHYSGKIGFMNRQRSLSSVKRDRNRREVVELVRRSLGTGLAVAPQTTAERPSAERLPPVRTRDEEPKASDRYQFKSCYKSGRFSHTEIRFDGETTAHCTKGLTTVFPRFRNSVDTRRRLRDSGYAEDHREKSGYYVFPGVTLEVFCKILGIAIPLNYRQS